MLTQKCVEELGKIFRFFHFFCISPYEWDKKSCRIVVTKSWWKYCAWKLQNYLFVAHTLYVTLSFVVRYKLQNFSSISDCMMHLLWATAYIGLVLAMFSNLFFFAEIQEFINQIIKTDRTLKAATMTVAWSDSKRDKLAKKMTFILPWCLENMSFVMIMYKIFQRGNPRLMGYLFRPLGWTSYIISFMLELGMTLHIHFIITLYWIIFFAIFSSVINHWVRTLSNRQSGANKLLLLVARRRAGDLKAYNQLQVLNRLYNDCLKTLAWPSFILCNLLCHSLVIYIAVKHSHNVNPWEAVYYGMWSVIWVVIAFVVYPHMGQTRELSQEYVHSLFGGRTSKLDGAILRSLRPLGVDVGHLYTMSRTTALTIVLIVSNLTINALLLV